MRRWLSTAPAPAGLRLVAPQGDFSATPAATRWCGGRETILLREGAEGPEADRLRAEVAPGFPLLFADGLFAGRLLDAPETRICLPSGVSSPSPADPEPAELPAEYVRLLSFPALDGLMDEDPAVRRALEDVAGRIDVTRGAGDRRAVLRDTIGELIQEWYEQ